MNSDGCFKIQEAEFTMAMFPQDGQSLKFKDSKNLKDLTVTQLQSDLGYPATLGPEHIRISDLAGYERYA